MAIIQGTTIRTGKGDAARRDAAAIREAKRQDMMEREAVRQALYRRQDLAGAVQVRQAEVDRLRRELADIETEISDAEDDMRTKGVRSPKLNGLRLAALDFPSMIQGAEDRVKVAQAALAAILVRDHGATPDLSIFLADRVMESLQWPPRAGTAWSSIPTTDRSGRG